MDAVAAERLWVEKVDPAVSVRGGFLPPLRITASGYRALAVMLEKHGWPEVADGSV